MDTSFVISDQKPNCKLEYASFPNHTYLSHCRRIFFLRMDIGCWVSLQRIILVKPFHTYPLPESLSEYHFTKEDIFSEAPGILILGGRTGAGKTEWLQRLGAAGEQVLDLEGLAGHKGSVFGKLDSEPQQSNDVFLHKISSEWMKLDVHLPVWIEEEAGFLGRNTIPPPLYQHMLAAPMIELDVPFEKRLSHILEEYGNASPGAFTAAIRRLEKRMGTSANHKALHLYNKGQLQECFALLLRYYDSAYEQRRTMYRKGNVISVNVEKYHAAELLNILKEFGKQKV